MKFKDLTGMKLGNFTVIEQVGRKNGKILWKCICNCGKEVILQGNKLTCKKPQKYCSSECECMKHDKKLHLKGQQFGRWTVMEEVEKPQHLKDTEFNHSYWLCQCECGNTSIIRGNMLTSGRSTSCGCYKKEKLHELGKEESYKRLPIKRGEEHYCYNPNLTDEERMLKRDTREHMIWKQQVKEQANYTCQCCGEHGGKLCSHHLDGYNWCEERRFDLSNGVCLCETCHKEFHHIYGYGNNTEEQYNEFINNKDNTEVTHEIKVS